MKQFYASTFAEFVKLMEMVSPEIGTAPLPVDGSVVVQKDRKLLFTVFASFSKRCTESGLTLSAISSNKISFILNLDNTNEVKWGPLRKLTKELQGRVIDELSTRLFIYVDPNKQRFIEEKNLFGEDVAQKFPSAIIDIEEAGKCLAFDRGTACVFHLMRVMEAGLRVLAKTLNDPRIDPQKNPTWDNILRKFQEELEKPRQQRAPEWKVDDGFFSGAAASLMAVKDAWRNSTMHIGIFYDEEKALDVWNHVRHFMRHLATKLSE